MRAFIESNFIQNPRLAAMCLDALLKSFLVLAFAGALCFIWRRAASATRHLIWFLALAGLLLLPLLPFMLPAARKPLWSVSGGRTSGNEISLSLQLTPTQSPAVHNEAAPAPANVSTESSAKESGKTLFITRVNHNWMAIGLAIWASGVILTLLYPVIGQFQLRKISRKARRLETPWWTSLLNETSATLGLRRRVQLLQTKDSVMPLTWGWWRPKVLLPVEAKQWPLARQRIVLLHELAHVKRWDCLTQNIARVMCALYWFNPLAWLATRRMCVERERACDDLVLNGGCAASDYANHLVEIAKTFRHAPQMAGIAMARPSGLEKRVVAIVDATRVRRFRPMTAAGVLVLLGGLIYCVEISSAQTVKNAIDTALGRQQLNQLKAFSKEKLKQAQELAESSGEKMNPEFQRLFDAAIKGDVQTVTNTYENFKKRHPQYSRQSGIPMDIRLCTRPWGGVLEICLAYDHIANCDPKFTQIAVDDVIQSIPPGSIYFGGTDPGRGLPTAFSKSHVNADLFYTLTQNALADGTYMDYLRDTYGERRHWLGLLADARRSDSELQTWDREFQTALDTEASLMSRLPENDPQCEAADKAMDDLRKKRAKRTDEIFAQLQARTDAQKKEMLLNQPPKSIYIPTEDETQKAFSDYQADAGKRLEHDKQFPNEPHQIRGGENVRIDSNGVVQVSGQIAVMDINARIAKIIFDKNPDREFYVEESFPLDWMYPHLEPHGLIMKIDREPMVELPDEVIQKDREYWQRRVGEWLGNWLTDETPVKSVTDFAEKVYVRKDLSGFTGDEKFIRDNYAPKMFSKWRGAIGGVYSWRTGVSPDGTSTPFAYTPKTDAGRQRMIKEADFALKQAFAICPASPEAVYRYINFLMAQGRKADALLVAQAAAHIDPAKGHFDGLVRQLSQQQGPSSPSAAAAMATADRLQQVQDLVKKLEAQYLQKKAELESLKIMEEQKRVLALQSAESDAQLKELQSQLDVAKQNLIKTQQDYSQQDSKVKSAETAVSELQDQMNVRMKAIMDGLKAKLDAKAAYLDDVKAQLKKLQLAAKLKP